MRKLTAKEFIERASKTHDGAYDYSKVNYSTNKCDILIICPIHGEFIQRAESHLNGHECPSCGYEKLSKIHRKDASDFISEAVLVHGDLYDYSKVVYRNTNTPVTIVCPIHGEFYPRPGNHVGRKSGCPGCKTFSRGEKSIAEYLTVEGIPFVQQKPIRRYRFDFALKCSPILIEYHGKQHYEANEFFGGSAGLKSTQKRDRIKAKLAKENGYRLITIPYTDFDRIPVILSSELSSFQLSLF